MKSKLNVIKNNLTLAASVLLVLIFVSYSLYFKNAAIDSYNQDCKGPEQNLLQCWEEIINQDLESKGLDQAFETLAYLYATQPVFAAECHSFTHQLGEKAYEFFAKNKEIVLSPKTSYCGYGFYHGFMETLLYSGGTITDAQDFCSYAGSTLKTQTSDAEGACYHGIGHGAVDGSDPRDWGNAQAMIKPGLELCQKVASDFTERFGKLYRCASGAYNALEILATDSKYRLDIINRDPFSFCSTQPNVYLEACFTNMLPSIFRITQNDFSKAMKLVVAIPEKSESYEIRRMVMLSLFHDFIRVNLHQTDYNIADGLKLCRELNEVLHRSCVEGLSGGYMKYGEPEKEYVKGLSFCASDLLTIGERDVCYSTILSRLRIWYTAEKTKQICDRVGTEYQRFCSNKY